MKKSIITIAILSIMSTTAANAITIAQADANVTRAETAYEQAVAAYKNAAYTLGSGVVGSVEQDNLNTAGQLRAEAYATQRAAVAAKQNADDTATKAQVIADRDAKVAAAKLNAPSATASHSQGWTMTPGITKESNPAGHPTNQVDPMDSNHWTQQPTIVKESNPAGHPTNQIGAASHLGRSYADINASAMAQIGASKQHDNVNRTASQNSLTAANQQRTASQVSAQQGAALTAMNQNRTSNQSAALAAAKTQAAAQQAAQAASYNVSATSYKLGITQRQQKQIGVRTPVESVPSNVKNISGPVTGIPFHDMKGNAGNHGGSHMGRQSGDNNGESNAHNNAMGRGDGVGSHSQFR